VTVSINFYINPFFFFLKKKEEIPRSTISFSQEVHDQILISYEVFFPLGWKSDGSLCRRYMVYFYLFIYFYF